MKTTPLQQRLTNDAFRFGAKAAGNSFLQKIRRRKFSKQGRKVKNKQKTSVCFGVSKFLPLMVINFLNFWFGIYCVPRID
jgi:hypothetical protein